MKSETSTPDIAPSRRSSPAERMRRSRDLRRRGMRWVRIRMLVTEIDGLVRKGYLEQEHRDDPGAVQTAAELLIGDALFEKPDAQGDK